MTVAGPDGDDPAAVVLLLQVGDDVAYEELAGGTELGCGLELVLTDIGYGDDEGYPLLDVVVEHDDDVEYSLLDVVVGAALLVVYPEAALQKALTYCASSIFVSAGKTRKRS